MIPIVFVLVYKLEKCIQHINKKEILCYLQKQLILKKNHLKHKKNIASGTFLLVQLNGIKLVY